jgi:hypothetical protein
MSIGVRMRAIAYRSLTAEALGVTGVERLRDLRDDRERPFRLEPPFCAQERLEVPALYEAHDEEELTVDLAGVVDRHDGRMLERGSQLRLRQKRSRKRLSDASSGAISLSAT